MADPYPEAGGFPDQHTTATYTTTTTTARTTSSPMATVDNSYARSLPGILKIVQIILGFLYWSVVASYYYGYAFRGYSWVIFVSVSAWIFTLIFFVLYLFSLHKRVTIINWPLTELLNNATSCLCHFIAACIISVAAYAGRNYRQHGKLVWGCICGWILFVLYGISMFLNFRDFQAMGGISSIRAQGRESTTTTTTSTTVVSSPPQPDKSRDPPPYPGGPFT